MQFIVVGRDGSDTEALNRRMAARQAHIEGFEDGRKKGTFLYAAAMLDDEGKMIGSTVICDFESRAELDAWLKKEPYIVGDVWKTVDITPCKVLPSCLAPASV
ncbi:MAG TPA: YciI family protein [Drouetiella sp.]